MAALTQTWNNLLAKGLIDPKYIKNEHLQHLSPESIKINLFNKMVAELKEPLPEGVFKVCAVHGNLTLDDAKLMPNGKSKGVVEEKRYSLRCNKCLGEYRRTYEIKNHATRSRGRNRNE